MITVSSGVITLELILVVIFGLLPIVASIYILVKKVVVGSSFWGGVLSYLISTIVSGIFVAIYTIIQQMNSQNISDPTAILQNKSYICFTLIVSSVLMCITVLLCCAKIVKTKTFKKSYSYGIGFAVLPALTIALNNWSNFTNSSKINNGTFVKQYQQFIDQKIYTTETVLKLQEVYTSITISDLIATLITTILSIFIVITLCTIISYGLNKKKGFITFLAATIVYTAAITVAALFAENLIIHIGIYVVLAIACFFIAKHIKDNFTDPVQNSDQPDSFINTINTAKESEESIPTEATVEKDEIANSEETPDKEENSEISVTTSVDNK